MKNHAAGKCGGEREKWLFMIRCEIETFVKSYAWLMWHWVGVKSEKVGVKFPTGGIESGEAWWELIARMWWWIMTSCSEHFIPKNDAKRVSDKMKLIKSVCWRKMAFPPFFSLRYRVGWCWRKSASDMKNEFNFASKWLPFIVGKKTT